LAFNISNRPGPVDAWHSGKVLDVSRASGAAGAPVIQWTNLGGPNQRFRFERLPDGFFRVLAKHSGKVLDVAGASMENGAPIIQWDWHGGDNQCWRHRAEVVID
jgi:ricin-type beta-trefoil lectin protein